MNRENQIVYGAVCTWFGDISETKPIESTGKAKLPGCPHCQGPLYWIDKERWDMGMKEFAEKHPGYLRFIEWTKEWGICFPTTQIGLLEFMKETGEIHEWMVDYIRQTEGNNEPQKA